MFSALEVEAFARLQRGLAEQARFEPVLMVERDPTSPWLLISCKAPSGELLDPGDRASAERYAIWRRTGKIHRVNAGAVEDEPCFEG